MADGILAQEGADEAQEPDDADLERAPLLSRQELFQAAEQARSSQSSPAGKRKESLIVRKGDMFAAKAAE